jgi:hypothetical protein
MENNKYEYIRSSKEARELIRWGFEVMDITPSTVRKGSTDFLFECTDEFNHYLKYNKGTRTASRYSECGLIHIKSARYARKLIGAGFFLFDIAPNRDIENASIFIFENTKEIQEYIELNPRNFTRK